MSSAAPRSPRGTGKPTPIGKPAGLYIFRDEEFRQNGGTGARQHGVANHQE